MSWENIGSVNTGSIPHEKEWILFSLGLAKSYVEFVCGDPPEGSKLDIMWNDHDLGSYPSLGLWSDYDIPDDYVNSCELALDVFNEAVDLRKLKEHFEERTFSVEDEKEEIDSVDQS